MTTGAEQQLVQELHALGPLRVPGPRKRHASHQDPVGPITRIDVAHRGETPRQESGADQKRQGEACLENHQRSMRETHGSVVADEPTPTGRPGPPLTRAEPGRHEAADDGGDQRRHQQKPDDPWVELDRLRPGELDV